MLRRKDAGLGIGDVDKKSSTVVGYAAAFGNKDSHNDIIEKGAFKRTIDHNSSRIKALMHHDPVLLVGKPTEIKEDEHGLYTESHISKTAQGEDLLTLIEDGVLDEMSIGFYPVKEGWDDDRSANIMSELKLVEYSFVTLASNPEARVQGLKGTAALDELVTSMRKMEKALRDGTFVTDEVPEAIEFVVKYWRNLLEDSKYEVVQSKDVVSSDVPEGDSSTDTRPHEDSADATQSEILGILEKFREQDELVKEMNKVSHQLGGN